MRTIARLLALAAIGLVAVAFAVSPAQGALGGVKLLSSGLGFQMTFNQPGSPIPAEPTGEMEVAYSTSDYAGGPTSHGLSSIWWPGSAGANAGPVFGLPSYPVRGEAFFPGKPHKQSTEYGPNTTMEASASGVASTAEAHTQNFGQADPAFVTGDFASSTSTSVKGDLAISEGSAQATDVTIAGVVHIDSIVTTAKAVTNGKTGKVDGETVVNGATVQGQGVTIDSKGVHAGGQDVPVFDPINDQQLQQALDQAGITMKVAKPVDDLKGSDAHRALGGLVVTFESGALNSVIPDQIRDQVKDYIQFNQTITLNFGAVTVDSETLGGFTFQPPSQPPTEPPGAPGSGGGSGGGGSFGGGSSGGGFGPVGDAPSGGGGGSGTGVATVPAALPIHIPPIHGVPAVVTALAIIAAVGSSRILKHVADKAVAARAADRCPLEDR